MHQLRRRLPEQMYGIRLVLDVSVSVSECIQCVMDLCSLSAHANSTGAQVDPFNEDRGYNTSCVRQVPAYDVGSANGG